MGIVQRRAAVPLETIANQHITAGLLLKHARNENGGAIIPH